MAREFLLIGWSMAGGSDFDDFFYTSQRVPPVPRCQVPGHGLQFVSRHSLQFSDAGMKIYLAGEAEAGSAGEQPAKE